ncbi:MAG: capsule assembly Wzi family protein [Treponema sp.]|nr:capsule assembly Wzi family protein [Treponema sp.]
MRRLISVVSFGIFLIQFLNAQESLKSTEEEYYNFLSLTGGTNRPSLNYRTLSDSVWIINNQEQNIWSKNNLGTKRTLWLSESPGTNWFTRGVEKSVKLKIYGPEWFNSYNAAEPYGQNDGALWQGKGYNTSLTAGARLEAFGFELTLKPQLSWSENKKYEYIKGVNGSPYSYFVNGIDLVQRYGDSSFWNFAFGDSEIRYTWHKFTLGFGTQNPWLGPAGINPMLGSNNAGGYPKIDIGFRRTDVTLPYLGWYIGQIESRLWTGCLYESDYFDSNPDNDKRLLTALSFAYKPSFVPGASIGINRIFTSRWKAQNLKYIPRLFTTEKLNDVEGDGEDQKVSINLDWLWDKVGFEVYGELGIDDFTSQQMSNPFHTAIYTVGVNQSFELKFSKLNSKFKDIKTMLILEYNDFEMSQDFQLQWPYGGYYFHGKIYQGYTNNGQILGAGSCYAGNAQFVGIKFFTKSGYLMPFFKRSSPDNNYIYSMAVTADASDGTAISQRHWARFKTHYSYGVELFTFLFNQLQLKASYEYDWITFPRYDDTKAGIANYYCSLMLKYNL